MSCRIGIVGIQHESNTFLPGTTSLSDFERDTYVEGAAILERMRPAFHEVGGFIARLQHEDVELVPLMFARAMPSGIIEKSTAETLTARAVELVKAAGTLDGLLVAPHGAGVSELAPDFDGHWLAAIRDAVGPTTPIVCTIDPHANLSETMVAACNAIVAYRTNPHIDQRDRGVEAADLLLRHLRGEIVLTQAAVMLPLIINIERQLTSAEPCVSLYEQASMIRGKSNVLSTSIVLGFPYADVAEMGSAIAVVCDASAPLAQACAQELADFAIAKRSDYRAQLVSVDAAIVEASEATGMTLLLDMGDNVGGGGPGNSTALVAAMHRARLGPSVATLFDAEAVQRAVHTGVGNESDFTIGAVDPHTSLPFTVRARVEGLYDGKFVETQPRHGGATDFDMGRTAVLRTHALTLIVTSRRLFPVSLAQYAACGLAIEDFRHVVAKGVHAPIAAYQSLKPRLIHVNTPGVTSADLSHFQFRARRRPLYPFEEIA